VFCGWQDRKLLPQDPSAVLKIYQGQPSPFWINAFPSLWQLSCTIEIE
jgi:hypothetical protein